MHIVATLLATALAPSQHATSWQTGDTVAMAGYRRGRIYARISVRELEPSATPDRSVSLLTAESICAPEDASQLAVLASTSNLKRYTEERRQQEHKIEAQRAESEKLAKKLEGTEVTIAMQTGEEDRIFGSITNQQVAEGLEAQGLPVDRRKIVIGEDIKTVGVYTATVRVSPEHTAEVKVNVVPNEDAI